MTVIAEDPPTPPAAPAAPTAGVPAASAAATSPAVLAVAAIASLGAGAIHATAAGAHSEHRAAAIAFVITAILQLAWGAWALSRSGRHVSVAGAFVNAGALGGWVLAKTTGISFVAGLDTVESIGFPDTLAAALAAVAVAGASAAVAAPDGSAAVAAPDGSAALAAPDGSAAVAAPDGSAAVAAPDGTAGAGDAAGGDGRRLAGGRPLVTALATVVTIGVVVPGMVQTASHGHAEGGHDHGTTLRSAVPYTGTLPVDLGGVPGVPASEVAKAEALVTASIQKLPQFADIPTIEAMGYRSIGDASTGFEHFIRWALIFDGRTLDPDYPESLVFMVDPATGTKKLSAAMFMANPGDTLASLPTFGGLMQWHIHDNLCFAGESGAWRVVGVIQPGGTCRPGSFQIGQRNQVPMVHVWIIPHACGPFAALEGVGAGQIQPGEERLCDHAHGAN